MIQLSQALFLFLAFTHLNLAHAWAHGIKVTDTLNVARDDYLFGSSNVWIQHRNIKNQDKGLCG